MKSLRWMLSVCAVACATASLHSQDAKSDPSKTGKEPQAAAHVAALVEKLSMRATKLDNIQAAMELKLIALDELKAGREPGVLLRDALPGLVKYVEVFANYKDPLGDACHETLQYLGADAIIAYARLLQSDKLKYNGLVQVTNGLTKALENTPQRTEAMNAALTEVVPLLDNLCRSDVGAYQLMGFSSALVALGEPAVPALLAGLKDTKPEIRRRYAYYLGRIGALAKTALAALGELKSDPEPSVREAAAEAIAKIEAAIAASVSSAPAKIRGVLIVMGEALAGAEVELTYFDDKACHDLANKKPETLTPEERKRLETGRRTLAKFPSDTTGQYVAVDLEPGWYMVSVSWTSDQTPRWHNSPFQGDWFVVHYRRNDPAKPFGFTAVCEAVEVKSGEIRMLDMKLPSR